MYTSKNSFFSKHPLVKDLQECLIGDSILFAETSLEWKEARKKISPAFYKGKLVSLIELARQSVKQYVSKLHDKIDKSREGSAEIDLI